MTDDSRLNFPPNEPLCDANGGIMRQSPKPWEAIGMSRATWYRHGKPTEKPTRYTQADVAKILGISLRTTQRDLARARQEERERLVARARELIAQGHGEDDAIAAAIAEERSRSAAAADDDGIAGKFLRHRIERFKRGEL